MTKTLDKHPFEGSGFIVLIYSDSRIGKQLDTLRLIKSEWPKIRVIFSGSTLNSKEIISLFREGLADYLTQPIEINDIMAATQRLYQIQDCISFNPSQFNLTSREFEVCKLLVEGLNGKKAAEYLGITPATIKVHKSRIMRKLQVNNLPDLVRMVHF